MLISLQPKQRELKNVIEHSHKYEMIGYGGARGGGKSRMVRDLAILFGFKYGVQSLIFRRYRDDLLKNHIYPMLKEHPALRAYFNKSELVLYNKRLNPIIKFDYADREDEIEKVGQGTEYPLIFIDEATQSTQGMIEYLTTANRDSQGLFPSPPKTIMTMNPGGVGHTYAKRIFIERDYEDNEKGESYYFIQAHVWDNVLWSARALSDIGVKAEEYYMLWSEEERKEFTIKYSDYAGKLSRLPKDKMLANLYGDWDAFGGRFFKEFNAKKQIIQPFQIPTGWELGSSMDPGFSSPLSFGLFAKDYDGVIYRIATYYEKTSIPRHASSIKEWLTSESSPLFPITRGRMPDWTVSGLDAFQKLDKNAIVSNEDTVEGYFSDPNIGLDLERAVTDRINGWWKMKALMPDHFRVFGNSLNKPLLEQIRAVESDQRIVEDIQGRGNDPHVEDHALDECRYGIQRISTPIKDKPDDVPEWYDKQMGKQLLQSNFNTTAMGV